MKYTEIALFCVTCGTKDNPKHVCSQYIPGKRHTLEKYQKAILWVFSYGRKHMWHNVKLRIYPDIRRSDKLKRPYGGLVTVLNNPRRKKFRVDPISKWRKRKDKWVI